jgi:hypothetical protein
MSEYVKFLSLSNSLELCSDYIPGWLCWPRDINKDRIVWLGGANLALVPKFINHKLKLTPFCFLPLIKNPWLNCKDATLNFPFYLLFVLINMASCNTFVYKYFMPELNKSVLNWTQVCQLHWKTKLHKLNLNGFVEIDWAE